MRRQLPAYSPLSAPGLVLAGVDALRKPEEVQAALRTHLVERFGADQVSLTGSGTQALQFALEAVAQDHAPGDPLVALPAYSCFDVLTAAIGASVPVRFYDIDPVSLTPDMSSLTRALEGGATTVVVGNLFAFPIDWQFIRAACRRHGALLIEDAAQGLGSGWGTDEAGSFGDLSVLSFGRGKGWTGGGGGALLARGLGTELMSRRAVPRGLSPRPSAGPKAAVLAAVQWAIGRPSLYGMVASIPGTGLGETHYREPVSVAGMPSFCAAAALRHAGAALALVTTRREWARRWDMLAAEQASEPAAWARCYPVPGGTVGYLRYPVLASGPDEAADLATRTRAAGGARGYPLALPDLPQSLRVVHGDQVECQGARRLATSLVTLPTHGMLTERDVEIVQRARLGPDR